MNDVVDNWVLWLQERIPELKKSQNEFWVRTALKSCYSNKTHTKDE